MLYLNMKNINHYANNYRKPFYFSTWVVVLFFLFVHIPHAKAIDNHMSCEANQGDYDWVVSRDQETCKTGILQQNTTVSALVTEVSGDLGDGIVCYCSECDFEGEGGVKNR